MARRFPDSVVALVALFAAVAFVALVADEALAVPPAEPFPAAVTPPDGSSLPSDGAVWIFGSDDVALSSVGVALSLDAVVVDVTPELIGCCAVRLPLQLDAAADGGSLSLLVSSASGELSSSWIVASPSAVAPTVGTPEVVQVVNVDRLLAPMNAPRDRPGWIVTLDVPGVSADAAALATYDDDGSLLTVEPPSGGTWERLLVGVTGERSEVCLAVEVVAAGGAATRASPVCTDLPAPASDDDAPPGEGAGCAATGSSGGTLWLLAAMLAPLFRARRRRRLAALVVVGVVLSAGACAPVEPLAGALCDDAFDDHTWPGDRFDNDFFDEHARAQYGWLAMKFLVRDLLDPERRRVAWYDDDFYELHDQWFTWRLVNGVDACGADGIEPVADAPAFGNMGDVIRWAREQERLPPFLSWEDDRLYAPDFYRLSRQVDPRVYAPAYVSRGAYGDDVSYVLRVGYRDNLLREHLEAYFETLLPLIPSGRELYWKPSSNSEQQLELADELLSSSGELAGRVIPAGL
jgi:hypothetical protein